MSSVRLRLVKGLIEITKYTYAGLHDVIFISLVCTKVGNNYVWFYDGTNTCFDKWRIIIICFALFYAINSF